MRTFFEQFIQNTHGSDTKAVTVLDGAHIGERAVLSGNGICWKSEENGFFATHEQQVLEKCGRKNGQVQIEGVRLFSEGMAYNKKMIICGGGHVGIAVARLALMTEFDVTVLEDRPKFAETARRIGVQRVICDSFENGLKQIPGDKDTYFVIVTRGHRFDQTCLEIAMEKPHAYIGMMGSHVRVARMKESLVEQGIAREQIDAVHTPVGLRIGAETPEEIAVSILAEIIQVKNQEQHIGGYNENILAGVKRAEEMGLQAMILSSFLEGESKDAGSFFASIAREAQAYGNPIKPPCVILSSGETTTKILDNSTITGHGGPGQELTLSFAILAAKTKGACMLSIDSEGTDGTTPVAGGICDSTSYKTALEKDVDVFGSLRGHACYEALDAMGDAVFTGNTGTNLCDFNVLYIPAVED